MYGNEAMLLQLSFATNYANLIKTTLNWKISLEVWKKNHETGMSDEKGEALQYVVNFRNNKKAQEKEIKELLEQL